MPLHPEIEYVLGLVEKAGYPEFCDLTPVEARALFEKTAPVLDAKPVQVAEVRDLTLETAGAALPARLYRPEATSTPLPVLLYYHGGGFVVGSLASYDALCRVLARESGALVLSVDYRLAPEHRFPAAAEDAVAALLWARENAGTFGGDGARLAVAGDSAGGNLAAVAAQAARDRNVALALQVLVYPVVGGAPETASHHAFAEGYLLTRRNVLWFYEQYAGDPADPRFAPLLTEDLGGLAPALILTAGYDPLRDEGCDYARRLIAAGNPVTLSNYAGMVHGFLSLSGAVADGRRALAQVAGALRESFASG